MPAWGFGMPPPGFDALLAQKYSIMQQEANARSADALANANFTNVRAGLAPAASGADVAKLQAETAGQNITNRFLPGTLSADINQKNAITGLENATAGKTNVETRGLRTAQAPLLSASDFDNLGLGLP